MKTFRGAVFCNGLFLVALTCGCGAKDEEEFHLAPNVPLRETAFYVSEYYAPTGHMGDGAVAGHIVQDIDEGCLARPVGAGGSCYHWQYTPGSLLWYAVYWQYPTNNWGNEVGRDIAFWVADPALGPLAIRPRYNRVRFYAAATRAGSPLPVTFYAGRIHDPLLERIHCPDLNQPCKHRDFVSTPSPNLTLTSSLEPFSVRLVAAPPCVANADGVEPQFGDNGCPAGTVRARSDGQLEVATCRPMHAEGQLQGDGSILCCTTALAFGACNGTSFAGSWQAVDEIYETVIGGFGWALNYAEYEAQVAAQVASGTLPADSMVDPATLPPTHLYIDDIVWDYAPQ